MRPSAEKQARLSCEEARERLEVKGSFLYWKDGPHRGLKAGWKERDSYWRVEINDATFLVHRVIWLVVHGAWPAHDIDHFDGDKGNNDPDNLREASKRLNMQNQVRPHSQNKAGLLGVSTRGPGRYRAQIKVNGATQRLGTFATPQEAHAAYILAKRQFHEGNTL